MLIYARIQVNKIFSFPTQPSLNTLMQMRTCFSEAGKLTKEQIQQNAHSATYLLLLFGVFLNEYAWRTEVNRTSRLLLCRLWSDETNAKCKSGPQYK